MAHKTGACGTGTSGGIGAVWLQLGSSSSVRCGEVVAILRDCPRRCGQPEMRWMTGWWLDGRGNGSQTIELEGK